MSAHPIIAIDGPAGAGKTSAARAVAARLGLLLLDTGAIYRAVALSAREAGVDWDDDSGLERIASGLEISFAEGPAASSGAPAANRVIVGGRDRSADIRTPEISEGASRVSARPGVRAALLDLQRRIGRAAPRGAVVEGRDVGTVVFPDAELKVFLTASADRRAERRCAELAAAGHPADLAQTLSEIQARDQRDSTREAAPLKVADDAHVLDSSTIPLAEVVDTIVDLYRRSPAGAGG
jgi:cytidylate kinase